MTAILALIALLLQTAPAAKGSIEGVVVDVNGRPVAGAQVELFSVPPPFAYVPGSLPGATTDSNGRFRVENLVPVGYRITVRATGFIAQEYGARPGRSNSGTGTPVAVAAGQTVQGVSVTLTEGGVVSGRITSVNGEPLLRMNVSVLKQVFDADGFASLISEGNAETNDRGEYRVADLAPGRYIVRATPVYSATIETERRRASAEGTPLPALPTPGNFSTTFYPGTPDSARATLVELGGGGEASHVDFTVPNLRTYRIRGRLIDASGESQRHTISIIPTPPTVTQGSMTYDQPSGIFELRDVPAGVHWLVGQPVLSMTAEERAERQRLLMTPGASMTLIPIAPRGATKVTVIDSDVDNVEIKVVRGLVLQGRVRVEGATTVSPEIRVGLRAYEDNGHLSPAAEYKNVSADGSFLYTYIPPWDYRVSVSGLPADLYIKAARLGNTDVLFNPFPLTEQRRESLEILLAKGAQVAGTLRDEENSQAVAGKEVVLIPASRRPSLYKTATTDAAGRFLIQGVAPGDYKIFSWQTLEPFRYFDTEFMREFEDRGIAVTVTEAARVNADAKVIP